MLHSSVTYLGTLETGYGERREEKEKVSSLQLFKICMGCYWCHEGIRKVETAAQLGKTIYPAMDSSGSLALYERAQQWLPAIFSCSDIQSQFLEVWYR